jgi:hypothetical protein
MHSRNLLADVENVVAKAIRDGAINAKIDHANGWLISKETRDIYATRERVKPTRNLFKRSGMDTNRATASKLPIWSL